MTTLERIKIKNFFSIGLAELEFENQGLVVVHGRVGSGKTALTCESVLYGLYGSSFEYGSNPGQSVKKNTEKEFSVCIWLKSESGRFRIMRGKDSELKLSGLELHRLHDDGTEDRLTRGTSKDTQKLISDGLLKMSERVFRRSVVCSTDMGKFPDASDSEKKSVLDELLELWIVQGAHEETSGILKALKSEHNALMREFQIAEQRLSEEEAFEISDSRAMEESLSDISDRLKEQTELLETVEELFEVKNEKLMGLAKEAKDHLVSLRTNPLFKMLPDTISEIKSSLRELKRIESLVEAGRCHECGQETESICPHNIDEEKRKLEENLEAELARKKSLDDRLESAEETVDTISSKSRKLLNKYQTTKDEINTEISSLHRSESRILSELTRAKDAEERIRKAKEAKLDVIGRIDIMKKRIEDEEILEELFSNRGFKLSVIRSVIPYMNEEAGRVAELLNTPIKVKFAIRGTDEAFSGNLSVEVHNPIGAWQYHGSSAGERRTIDIIILMCLMSLSNKRNNRFNHVFFDETFEKLDPPLQRAVLMLLKEISQVKSSVFLITHSAGEIKQDVDQTWEVSRGGQLAISKS
jgi:DNA repair exonuclease SbcCD ATPase subunit